MASKGRKEVSGDFDPEDREAAVKHLMQIPYVGKKTAGILYDSGFKTIRHVQAADEQALAMVNGIGKKLGKKIKAGAEELEVVGGSEPAPTPAPEAPPEEPAVETPAAEEPPAPEPAKDESPPAEPIPEPVTEEPRAEEAPSAPEEPAAPEPAPEEPVKAEEPPTAITEAVPAPIVEAAPPARPKDDDLPYEIPEEKPAEAAAPTDQMGALTDEEREAPVEGPGATPGQKDAASMLLQWQLDGFDVSSVERMIFAEGAKQDEILGQFVDNIRELDRLKAEIGKREFPKNMDEDVKGLVAMLSDPMKVADIAAKLGQLDGMKRAKMVEAELDSIEGMDKDKEEIRALLADQSKIAQAEARVKKLKRAKKESFFELEFTKHLEESEAPSIETKRVVIESKPAVVKSRVPMIVEAVFLTSADGKPMSFRTRKPRSEVGMNWLKGAAGAVRMLVVSSKEKEGEAFDGAFEGAKTLVCKGELAWLGIVYVGEEHPLGRRMLKTALGVMEAKHYHDLKGWDGKTGVTSVGKSMNAIIPAFIKLNRMAKA